MEATDQLDLDQRVKDALDSKRGDWPGIAEKAGVSHSWISQYVRGKIPNPGFETLKRLHGALFEAA